MKENQLMKKISYAVVSAALFAVLFVVTFPGKTAPQNTAQLVTFGDSVFGLVRDESSIPSQLAERLGMTCYNAALGGTTAGRRDLERRMDDAKDSLSLVGLMRSVEAGDFGVQQAARIRESSTEYFGEVIDGLELIDFSKVELVLIQHGLNDYYSGIPIEKEAAPYDEYTFQGALRTALTVLREKYPHIRVVLVSPTYTWHIQKQLTCEEFDVGYGVMEDYVQAQKEVAEEFGVEMIDLYHDFFPHENWADWELYTFDGLHPNDIGREMIAEKIAEELLK